ncbi:MAG: hypothetical protein RL685_7466 [Pseudomonadota bacterium]|jgi:hypothetical protein
MGVVARSHVERGVAGGFAQVCHGRRAPLERMRTGDYLVYYSATTEYRGGEPLRAFTALGRVQGEQTYSHDMGDGFVPFRKEVSYLHGVHAAEIRPLLTHLHFVQQQANWGLLLRRGHFEIDAHDLALIASAMGCATAQLALSY